MSVLNSSSDDKESTFNAGDLRSIPGSGRLLGKGTANPLQYPCLENSMGRGAWGRRVSDVTEQLISVHACTHTHTHTHAHTRQYKLIFAVFYGMLWKPKILT